MTNRIWASSLGFIAILGSCSPALASPPDDDVSPGINAFTGATRRARREARYYRSGTDDEALFYLANAHFLRAAYRFDHDKGMWGAAPDGEADLREGRR